MGKWFNDLPKHPRTLLNTNTSVVTREVPGGVYCHVGIENGINDQISSQSSVTCEQVVLQINIDGLPLYKSSSSQMWPILGMIENYRDFGESKQHSSPFIIGIFHGKSKPLDLNEYLKDFIKEVCSLQTDGIVLKGCKCHFRISAFVCDMPARAFVKSVTGHGGYGGCDQCTQRGKYVNSVTFPDCHAPLRTDDSFLTLSDENHHRKEKSPLLSLSIGMVSQFPIDYMHLVCLGVVRKLVTLWLSGPLATRIGRRCADEISHKLILLRSYMPIEFQRKPRAITEYERWKATEFRQLLLYSGCIVLRDSLPTELYNNFMLLSVGISILLDPVLCTTYRDCSKNLLIAFVKHFGELYGPDKISYNVHGLVHLSDVTKRFGSLDCVSSFPFENFLGQLKRMLRKPNSPLQQVVRRLSERQTCVSRLSCVTNTARERLREEHHEGPVLSTGRPTDSQYKQLHSDDYVIKLTDSDRFVLLANGDIVSVENIIKSTDGHVRIVYRKFSYKEDVFLYPIPSTHIGVFKLQKLGGLHDCEESSIVRKYVVLPYKSWHIGMPLLHA